MISVHTNSTVSSSFWLVKRPVKSTKVRSLFTDRGGVFADLLQSCFIMRWAVVALES